MEETKGVVDAQHAVVGIRAASTAGFQRTTQPDAQWFGTAGLGLFMHWGTSSVRMKSNLLWV